MKRKIWNVWNQKCLGLVLLMFLMLSILPVQKVKADFAIEVKNNFKSSVAYSVSDKKLGYGFAFTDLSMPPEPEYPGHYTAEYGERYAEYREQLKKIEKSVKIVSSNKSVATVKGYTTSFTLYPKKVGNTRITYTAVINGKTIKRSGTVSVVKFQNPFSSLKIDGKNYTSKVNGSYNLIYLQTKKAKIKLNYKLNSDWKIAESYILAGNTDYDRTNEKVKNGGIYSVKGVSSHGTIESKRITFVLKHKKNGMVFRVLLFL